MIDVSRSKFSTHFNFQLHRKDIEIERLKKKNKQPRRIKQQKYVKLGY